MALITALGISTALATIGISISATSFFAGAAAWILNAAVGFGINFAMNALFAPKPPTFSIKGEIQGGGDVPRTLPLGYCVTAGSLVYANSWGKSGKTPNAYFTQVICVGDWVVNGLDQVYVNGALVELADTPHAEYGYPVLEFRKGGKDHLWIKFYDGSQTAADDFLVDKVASVSAPWETTRVGVGCPYVIATSKLNAKLFTGFPTFKFALMGAKLYDITKDSTRGGTGTHRWNNPATWGGDGDHLPAVQAYSLFRGLYWNNDPDAWFYGLQNVNAAMLPNGNWIDAVNSCRALVTGSEGTVAIYRSGGEIPVTAALNSTLEALMTTCQGRLSENGGVYKMYPGTPGTSTFNLTDPEIISTQEQSFTPFFSIADTINSISGKFPDPIAAWNYKPLPAIIRNDLEALAGNRRLIADISFDLVPYEDQCQRLMKTMIDEAQRARRHTLTLPPYFAKIEPGDFLDWTSDRNGYDDKQFRVDGVIYKSDLDILVDITEVDPADYDWDFNTDFTDDPLTPIIKDPPPSQSTIIAFEPVTYLDALGNPRRPGLKAVVDGDLDDVATVSVQIRLAGEVEVIYEYNIPYGDVGDDDSTKDLALNGTYIGNTLYEGRGRHIPIIPRDTEWSDWLEVTTPNVGIGIVDLDPDAPGVPTGLMLTSAVVDDDPGYVKLTSSWTANDPADEVAYYDLEIKEGAGNYVSFPVSTITKEFRLFSGVDIDARIRAVNGLGKASAFSTVVEHTTALDTVPPATPTGLAITPHFEGFWLEWNPNFEPDLNVYEVYEHTAATPAPVAGTAATYIVAGNQLVLSGYAKGDTRWFWLRATDRSGNKSAWTAFVTSTVVGIQSIDIVGEVDLTSIATGLGFVEHLAVLPATGNFQGRTVFLTTNNKIYRHTGSPTNASGFTVYVDGGDITALSITAAQIQAGAIGADQIAANAIRTKHLLITDFYNNVKDSFFADSTSGEWTLGAGHSYIAIGGVPYETSATALGVTGANADASYTGYYPCVPGQKFALEVVAMHTGASGGNAHVFIQFMNNVGSVVSQSFTTHSPADTAFAWYTRLLEATCPSGAVKMRLLIYNGGAITGQYRIAHIAFYRQTDSVLIANGAITAAKVSTNEIITDQANIADAIITDAKIVSLNAAKIQAGSILSGEVIVGGRAIGTFNTELFVDDFSAPASGAILSSTIIPGAGHTWYVVLGAGGGTFTASATAQSGPNVLRLSGTMRAANKLARVPYDPNKLYRIRIRIRMVSSTVAGLISIGVQGLTGDGTTSINPNNGVEVANGSNGHWPVALSFSSASLPGAAAWVNYEGYIKGNSNPALGATAGTAGGTIAAKGTMQPNTRFISPIIGINEGGTGDAVIDVDYFAIHQVDEDAAAIVNAGTVKITPGQILIDGGTTLADWRQGGDLTKIAGGNISTNTIDANKLNIGMRNIKLVGVTFEYNDPSTNRVSWTGGSLQWVNDAGVLTTSTITAWPTGSLWTSGALYLYWDKTVPTNIQATTNSAVAYTANTVVLAVYRGGTLLDTDIGKTIIDGSNIKTGSIDASRISTYNLTAANATIANGVITNAMIANAAITSPKRYPAAIHYRRLIK